MAGICSVQHCKPRCYAVVQGKFFFQCTAIYTENLCIRTAGACSLVCVLHTQRLFTLTENCQVVRQDHGVVRLQDDV